MMRFRALHSSLKYLVLLTVLATCACASSVALAKESINILAYKVLATDAMQKLQDEFEKETGIKVNWEFASEPEVWDKITMEFAARTGAYDLFPLPFSKLAEFAEMGLVEPVDDYIKKYPHTQWLDLDDLIPGALEAMRYKGKLYGLPFFMWQGILAYRADVYKAAGIGKPAVSLTEFGNIVQKTTVDSNGDGKPEVYGFAGRGSREPHSTQSLTFAHAFGGEFLDKDMKPAITTPQFVKGVDLYARLLRDYGPPGAAVHDWWDIQSLFLEGKVANLIDACTEWAPMFESPDKSRIVGKVGYALAPKEARPGGYMYVAGWGIPVTSRNKQAAWKFVQWATSKDFQYESMLRSTRVDVTSQSVVKDRKFAEKYPYIVPDPLMTSMLEVHPNYFPHIPEYTQVMREYLSWVSLVIAGQLPTEKALRNAADGIYQILKSAGYYR